MNSALRIAKSTRLLALPAVTHILPSLRHRCITQRMVATYREQPDLAIQSAASHFKRQRHLPYFLEYLMWVVFGSEALHLIWLKMEYKEYKEASEHKIMLLKEIVERIEAGQNVDDNLREEIRMVLLGGKRVEDDIDDDYLDNLIASSESAEHNREVTSKAPAGEMLPLDILSSETEQSDKPKKTSGKFFF